MQITLTVTRARYSPCIEIMGLCNCLLEYDRRKWARRIIYLSSRVQSWNPRHSAGKPDKQTPALRIGGGRVRASENVNYYPTAFTSLISSVFFSNKCRNSTPLVSKHTYDGTAIWSPEGGSVPLSQMPPRNPKEACRE